MSSEDPGGSGKPPDSSKIVDKDGFTIPTQRNKRGRPRGSKKTSKNDSLVMETDSSTSENSFGVLTDDDSGETKYFSNKKRKENRKIKPPPVYIPEVNYREMEKRLVGIDIPAKNLLKRITDDGKSTKIFVTTCEEHRILRGHLQKSFTKYITYTPRDERLKRFVMYGLPQQDVELIKSELKEVMKIEPVEVKEMKIQNKKYHGQAQYLIYFQCDSYVGLQDLQNIRGICGYRVSFQRYIKKGLTQCYNCQKFHHASRNCTLDPVCNRCNGAHKSMNCNLVDKNSGKVPQVNLKCRNCSGNHTSSFKQCPYRLKLEQERLKRVKQLEFGLQRNKYEGNYKNYEKSFPKLDKITTLTNVNNVVDNHEANVNNVVDNNIANVAWDGATFSETVKNTQEENNDMFTPEQLREIFMEIVSICKNYDNKMDQLMKLAELVQKYV